MPEVGKPRRWRFRLRYSLRTLLAFVTVIGVLLGYWTNLMVRKRTAVLRFYELTAHRQATGGEVPTTMGYRYQGRDDYYKPIIPKWLRPLRDMFGEEAFGEVTGVQLTDTTAGDEDLKFLAELPDVERLWLGNTRVTDAGLVRLRACPKLRFLVLDGTEVSDRGLAELGDLKRLETLSLNNTRITEAGLSHLEQLPLQELWIGGISISEEGHRRLKAALPKCAIHSDISRRQEWLQFLDTGTPAR